jgi:hypothetical protein
MCALSPQKCGTVCGRDRQGSCLMPMLAVHPCIHSGTLSLPNRASRTVKKEFACFLSVKSGFPGRLDLRRSPKTARCSAKAPSCSVSHVLLRSSRRILFSSHTFLKSTSPDLGGGGLVQAGGLGAVWRSLVSPQHAQPLALYVSLICTRLSGQGTPPIYWHSR